MTSTTKRGCVTTLSRMANNFNMEKPVIELTKSLTDTLEHIKGEMVQGEHSPQSSVECGHAVTLAILKLLQTLHEPDSGVVLHMRDTGQPYITVPALDINKFLSKNAPLFNVDWFHHDYIIDNVSVGRVGSLTGDDVFIDFLRLLFESHDNETYTRIWPYMSPDLFALMKFFYTDLYCLRDRSLLGEGYERLSQLFHLKMSRMFRQKGILSEQPFSDAFSFSEEAGGYLSIQWRDHHHRIFHHIRSKIPVFGYHNGIFIYGRDGHHPEMLSQEMILGDFDIDVMHFRKGQYKNKPFGFRCWGAALADGPGSFTYPHGKDPFDYLKPHQGLRSKTLDDA